MVEYNEPMLKQIFQFRSDEFESKYAKQIENELSKRGIRKKQDKLFNILEKYKEYNDSELIKVFNDFENAYFEEINYWIEKYYQLGFCDAMKLKKELEESSEEIENGKSIR